MRLAALVALLAAAPTDRFYSDLDVSSASGKYRLTAKSPDNADPARRRPFQKDFVYTLSETAGGRVLWTRKQAPDEASPLAAWVDDGGRVVVRSGWDVLSVHAPDGALALKVDLLGSVFTPEEKSAYVHQTTAGPIWSGYARWTFARLEGRSHFCLRPWWGRRILVDVEAGLLRDPDDAASAALERQERENVLEGLRRGVARLRELGPAADDAWKDDVWPVLKVAYWAGKVGAKEAVPLLQELEASAYGGRSTGMSGYRDLLHPGDIHPFSWNTFTLRQAVQLSQRRLGARPKGFPVTSFRVEVEEGLGPVYRPKETAAPRSDRVGLLLKGMTPKDVLDAVGAPDVVETWRHEAWEYDIDEDQPYTLRVSFKDLRVAQLERIIPPAWRAGDRRDRAIVE